jgi:microcystin-dependent protein|tara:strand:- start:12014 stop:13162 length:1149 start_codon:yes stop_codon:yes gene_type:complete
MSTQNCSNCYNGCTEITSDKCVKYTGVDVPILGIKNGDSLSFVEQALITFLGAALDGTGILPVVPASDICPVVQANLDDCNPLSLNNYLVGIIKTICILNEQLENIQGGAPNGAYTLECVTGVQNPNSTSDVLQQTIVKLCEVEQSLNTFITDVTNNYVQIVDINTYIANYFNTNPEQQLLSNRMVPGSAQAYFGALTPFDASGAGIGVWDRIFLCNGNNGTPDLRGRVIVTVNSAEMGGGSLDNAVNPSLVGNPAYNINSQTGTNQVTLSIQQMPGHGHTTNTGTNTTGTSNPATHKHQMLVKPGVMGQPGNTDYSNPGGKGEGGRRTMDAGVAGSGSYNAAYTELEGQHNHAISIDQTGGGLSHDNYQPSYSAYYIIYLP